MRKYTLYNDGFTFQRINKTQAERAYKNGLTIIVSPVNINPFGIMGGGSHITLRPGDNFNKVINAFEYYNCTNSEIGRYAAFYIPVRSNEFDNRPEYDYSYLQQ